MLTDLDHLQLAMPKGEEEAARRFYGGLLGLEEIAKPEHLQPRGGVWFKVGMREIHLGVEADFSPAKKAHPAFLVDDLGTLKAGLKAAGYPIVVDEPLPGYDRFWSEDPFGNRLEFMIRLQA